MGRNKTTNVGNLPILLGWPLFTRIGVMCEFALPSGVWNTLNLSALRGITCVDIFASGIELGHPDLGFH